MDTVARSFRLARAEAPLIGFFANGEISDGRLHGYTGIARTPV